MFDRRIKLRHLVCFLTVARRQTIAAAADELAMTQPAASKTVIELEEILGARLFERSRRGMTLTAVGRLFLRHAEAGLAALRQGVETVAEAGSAGEDLIRVGALPTVAARLMPAAVRRFRQGGSLAVVRIVTGSNTVLNADLRAGSLDLVVGRMAEADGMTGLSFEHLYSERVAFVVRPGHPLLAAGFEAAQIRRYPLLMPTPGSIIRPTVDRFLTATGIGTAADRIETVSTSFGRAYVAASDAVWIISLGAVEGDVRDGLLALLPVDTRETYGPVGLTMRAEAVTAAPTALFIDALRAAAAGLRRDG